MTCNVNSSSDNPGRPNWGVLVIDADMLIWRHSILGNVDGSAAKHRHT